VPLHWVLEFHAQSNHPSQIGLGGRSAQATVSLMRCSLNSASLYAFAVLVQKALSRNFRYLLTARFTSFCKAPTLETLVVSKKKGNAIQHIHSPLLCHKARAQQAETSPTT
jgi:hypothetical protein